MVSLVMLFVQHGGHAVRHWAVELSSSDSFNLNLPTPLYPRCYTNTVLLLLLSLLLINRIAVLRGCGLLLRME